MDSDLAWVNGKSGRESWRYADAFQRSIISEAIYHFYFIKMLKPDKFFMVKAISELRGVAFQKQESLANAKVSARQQCGYEGPYREEIYGKSTQGT